VLGLPAPAAAHGMRVGEFYAGLAQPLFHPESLLLLLAFGIWAGRREPHPPGALPLVFVVAVGVGASAGLVGLALPPAAWAVRAGALVFGLLAAAERTAPLPVAALLCAVVGLGHGHVAAFEDRGAAERPILYALGVALAPLLAWGQVAAFTERVRAFWARVGLRVAASWIATIALLVSALGLSQ